MIDNDYDVIEHVISLPPNEEDVKKSTKLSKKAKKKKKKFDFEEEDEELES